jgi:hypothetical protein
VELLGGEEHHYDGRHCDHLPDGSNDAHAGLPSPVGVVAAASASADDSATVVSKAEEGVREAVGKEREEGVPW